MPNFQNSLGCLMPDANKRALVEMLAVRKLPLIEDDVDGELYFGATKPPAAKAFKRIGLVMHAVRFRNASHPVTESDGSRPEGSRSASRGSS